MQVKFISHVSNFANKENLQNLYDHGGIIIEIYVEITVYADEEQGAYGVITAR